MKDTAPLNLYALTYLLPSGKLFLQANRAAMLFDYTTGKEDRLPSVPGAARTYPATAASVMMPLTPANNYAATILICGGSDIEDNQWDTNWNIAQVRFDTGWHVDNAHRSSSTPHPQGKIGHSMRCSIAYDSL